MVRAPMVTLTHGHHAGNDHLILGKDDPSKHLTLCTIGPLFLVLFVIWLFYFARKDLFKDKSNLFTALAGFTFCVTSVSMHTLNKAAVSFTHQPATVTSIQMLVAVITLLMWHWKEVFGADRRQLVIWCLVPVAYAAMLNTSLFGYQYLSLTLVTVFRNLAPLVTMIVERLIMPPEHQPKVNLPILISLAVMVVGAFLFSWTEAAFSWIGLGLVVLNTLLAIADRVLQRRLLVAECKDLPLSACMVVNNSLGMIPTLFIAWSAHEFAGFEDSAENWRDPGIITLVIMSGFMGVGIGIAGLMCQKAMTATSFQVLQNSSKVAVVAVGVGIFHDEIHGLTRMLGIFLSLAGSMAYGYGRTLESLPSKGELKPLKEDAIKPIRPMSSP